MNHRRRPSIEKWVSAAMLASSCAAGYANEVTIDEVIVTAQKRSQNLQETPIAISALTAEMIDRQDIRNISAINSAAPNVRLFNIAGDVNGAIVAMRGSVTTNPSMTFEPTVGIYLDGIFIGKSYGSVFDIADLERIEVLRGPQGTLYGKNTLAGAINLITKQPTGEFGGKIKVGAGNYDRRATRLDIDLPAIGEIGSGAGRLSTKVSLSTLRRDGFIDNNTLSGLAPASLARVGGPAVIPAGPASTSTIGALDSKNGRFAALWQPSDSVDITYANDFSSSDAGQPYGQLTYTGALLQNIVPDVNQFVSNKRLDEASLDGEGRSDVNIHGNMLTATWNVGAMGSLGDVTLKSLSSHRKIHSRNWIDQDGTPYPLANSALDMRYRAVSQEFQWLGSSSRINYIGGLYFFREKGDIVNPIDYQMFGVNHIDSRYGFDNDAWALFGQFEWTPPILEDRLKLTVGARHTEEKKEVYRSQITYTLAAPTVALVGVPPGTERKTDFTNFSPMAVVAYQLGDNINVYAKIAEGWKSGGFNTDVSTVAAFEKPFKAESTLEYEIGLKSQWLDNRLRTNIAFFIDEHTDQQISQFLGGAASSTILTNAGASTIQGVELELVAAPIENLQLTLNYGYLDAEFDEYDDTCQAATPVDCAPGVQPGQLFDASNHYRVPTAPRNTASAGISYTVPLNVGEIVTNIDWNYVDEHVNYPVPSSFLTTTVEGYGLVDARLSWRDIPLSSTSRLAVSLWGKNLADKEYTTTGIARGAAVLTSNFFGDPRTFGIDVTLDF
jgi:iron complex outermembrane receptor protein